MADVFRANPYWRGKVTSSRGSEAQANRASSLRVRDLSVLARRGACVSRSLYRLILWRIRSFPGFELTRCAAPNRLGCNCHRISATFTTGALLMNR